jgi:ribokinase
LEIPLAISLAALRIARQEGVRTIFNPAPAKSELPAEIYALCDVICPNESETQLLTRMPVDTPEQCVAAARELLARGAGTVILTLGQRGSVVVTADQTQYLPARQVQAVDSTGAGDAYVGSLAYCWARGDALSEAARRAGAIATRSVLKRGTQSSFPTRQEVADVLA